MAHSTRNGAKGDVRSVFDLFVIGVCAVGSVVASALGDGGGASSPLVGPLAGPRVAAGASGASLVARGLDGSVTPLEAPPAVEALRLVSMDEATRRAVEGVLAERAALVEGFIRGHVDLLTSAEAVMAAGTAGQKLVLMRDGLAALEPLRAWGRVRDRVAAVLPAEVRGGYEALIEEYEAATLSHALASGSAKKPWEHRMARHWQDLMWEIQAGAERVFPEDDGWLERLAVPLGLTAAQQSEIREMAEKAYIDGGYRLTEAQKQELFQRIRMKLTVEQRWKLMGMMLRGELEERVPGMDGE